MKQLKKQFLDWYHSTSSVWDETSASRLNWLVVTRMALLFMLLVIAVFMQYRAEEPLPAMSLRFFYFIIIVSFLLSMAYFLLIRRIRRLAFHVYLQALFDVCLITALVYATGGARSVYPVFYPLVIIYTVVFVGLRGGLLIATLASVGYGLFVNLEFNELINPLLIQPEAMAPDQGFESSGYVLFRVLVQILSFYMITFLASFVVGQERKTRQLLHEKERAFAELDSLHRSIIESVLSGILTVDLHGRIKSFNRAAEEITGLAVKDVLERPVLEVMPEYDAIRPAEGNEEGDDSKRERAEIVIQSQAGLETVLGCTLSSLKNKDGIKIGNILIFQDITQIKEMERAYEESRKMAFIGEMAAILAHEIRNPLASISGSIQLLRKSVASNVDERLLQIILRGKDQLESFIKDFLILARPASGVYEEIDVSTMLEEILDTVKFAPSWHEGISIDVTYPEKALFKANRTEMRQLLWNLILNAVQAMPDGGKVGIVLNFDTEPDGSSWMVAQITDQGCGIDEKDIKRIFEPFFTTKEQGTGLGLAIVNRIVTFYGGHVIVDSVPGQGTAFTVKIPASF